MHVKVVQIFLICYIFHFFNFKVAYTITFRSGSDWLRIVPWGFRKLLVWIKKEYGDVPVIVTENGVSDRESRLDDEFRANFFRDYINEMLKGSWKAISVCLKSLIP